MLEIFSNSGFFGRKRSTASPRLEQLREAVSVAIVAAQELVES
jgi:hypothetical protein